MTVFPYKPIQAGYTVAFDDGLRSIALEGGPPRIRRGYDGAPREVSATWVLIGEEYDYFQGAVRAWVVSGGAPFEMPLVIDASASELYKCQFQPKSVRTTSVVGNTFTVTAVLWVRPLKKYLDPATDPIALVLAWLEATYGDMNQAYAVLVGLEEFVRRLPGE